MTPPVKARSGHIILDSRGRYDGLLKVYADIHRRVVEANRPFAKEAEPLVPEVLLEENLRDIRANRKPCGYNRADAFGMRLVFPLCDLRRPEFYFAKPSRCQEVVQLTEEVSTLLRRRGVRHTVEYDRLPLGAPGGMPPMPAGTTSSPAHGPSSY